MFLIFYFWFFVLKKFMNKKLLATILGLVMLAGSVGKASAQEYCESIYGGGQVCYEGDVMVDKMVGKPGTSEYVDNLDLSNAFYANSEIIFKITVRNTGEYKIDRMYVRDTLPSYLTYVSGPEGDDLENISYDSGSRVLYFEVVDLEEDETRDFYFKAKVVSESDLPEGSICVVNHVKAEANGKIDEATSQICIKAKVLGVTVMPPTGANDGLVILMEALGMVALGGLTLRVAKKADS